MQRKEKAPAGTGASELAVNKVEQRHTTAESLETQSEITRQKRWRSEHPAAYRAHRVVGYAVKTGRLPKPERCSECGRSNCKLDHHHPDHAKPLETVVLCRSCHVRHHWALKKAVSDG